MKRSHIYLSIALALASGALVSPAVACSGSGIRFEQAQAAKPLIEFAQLNPAQVAELKAYAERLKSSFATVEAEFQTQSEGLKGEAWRKLVKEFEARQVTAAHSAAEPLSFRTTMTVGNGMLCGAQIKVQVPPAPNNLIVTRDGAGNWEMWTYGEGKGGGREEGQLSPNYLRGMIDRLAAKDKQ